MGGAERNEIILIDHSSGGPQSINYSGPCPQFKDWAESFQKTEWREYQVSQEFTEELRVKRATEIQGHFY